MPSHENCRDGYIWNPITNKCVKITGKAGKAAVALLNATCKKPELKNDLSFAPRCDILEYAYCLRRMELLGRRHSGGSQFDMCAHGTLQASETCYFNSLTNSILLTPALAYHAYAKMFEYITEVFIPGLSARQVAKLDLMSEIADPQKCSLDENMNFFMMLFAFFCSYHKVIKETHKRKSVDYTAHAIKTLLERRSLESKRGRVDIQGGHPDDFIEPLFKHLLELKYKYVDVDKYVDVLTSSDQATKQTRKSSANDPDLLIVKKYDGGKEQGRRLARLLILILWTFGNKVKRSRSQQPPTELPTITKECVLPETLTADYVYRFLDAKQKRTTRQDIFYEHQFWGAKISKVHHLKMYERLIKLIRAMQVPDLNTKLKANTFLLLLQRCVYEKDFKNSVYVGLVDLMTFLPSDSMRYRDMYIHDLPLNLPRRITYDNVVYILGFSTFTIRLEKGSHSVVGTICDGKEIVSDSNYPEPSPFEWTDAWVLLGNDFKAFFEERYNMSLVTDDPITVDHLCYIRSDLEKQTLGNMRELHNSYLKEYKSASTEYYSM